MVEENSTRRPRIPRRESASSKLALIPPRSAQRLWDAKVTGFGVIPRQEADHVRRAARIKGEGQTDPVARALGAGQTPRSRRGAPRANDDGDAGTRQGESVARGRCGPATTLEAIGTRDPRRAAPTLTEASTLYADHLRAVGKRPTSIAAWSARIGHAERSYLLAWLDRPLALDHR